MFPSYHSLIFCLFVLIFTFFMCSVYWQSFSSIQFKKICDKEMKPSTVSHQIW